MLPHATSTILAGCIHSAINIRILFNQYIKLVHHYFNSAMISSGKPQSSSSTAVVVSSVGVVSGGIALSVILLVSSLAFLPTTTISSYATVSPTNMTGATTTEGQQQPAGTAGTQMFAIQNTSTSVSDPTPGHEEAHQAVYVLPPRDDGKLYTGTLTYTSSRPVEVVILQQFNLNQTATGGGDTPLPLLAPGQEEAITLIHELEGDQFDNLNFAGSVLAFHSRTPEPFTVTYTIVGELVEPTPLPSQ
jgi:hypothetical protein